MIYFRGYKLKVASEQLGLAKKLSSVTDFATQALILAFEYFSGRIFATAGGWYANDIFLCSKKLFQSEFISVIRPGSKSIIPSLEYNLINVSISLCGY
jgi:hypothetical protein